MISIEKKRQLAIPPQLYESFEETTESYRNLWKGLELEYEKI
jgi:hypothetical protein